MIYSKYDSADDAVAVMQITANGVIEEPSWPVPHKGHDGCKVSVDGRFLFLTNTRNLHVIDLYNETTGVISADCWTFDVMNSSVLYVECSSNRIWIFNAISGLSELLPFQSDAKIESVGMHSDSGCIAIVTINRSVTKLYICQLNDLYRDSNEYVVPVSIPSLLPYLCSVSFTLDGREVLVSGFGKVIKFDIVDRVSVGICEPLGMQGMHIYFPVYSMSGNYIAFFFSEPGSPVGSIAITDDEWHSISHIYQNKVVIIGPMAWTSKERLLFCHPLPKLLVALQ